MAKSYDARDYARDNPGDGPIPDGHTEPVRSAKANSLPYIDISSWDKVAPPLRPWWVEDRIPLRQPSLISGEGGIGKSILVLQLLVSTALGLPWCKIYQPFQGPVIYYCAEEEADEQHRRLKPILTYHGHTFAELSKAGFRMVTFAGKDAVLATFNRQTGRIKPTDLFNRLYADACALQPKGIVIDTVSDVFLGDEIKRDQVRQFVGLLRKLAIDSNSGVLLNSHPSLTGMKSGSGLSGSTQWHNSVRARAYFRRPKATKDEDDDEAEDTTDDGRRELKFLKNQYGQLLPATPLVWTDGLWLPISADAIREINAEDLFLQLLNRFIEQGRNVSPNKSSTYAPAKFAEQPEAKAAKVSAKALAAAMERLLAQNKIKVVSEGPPSRRTFKLEIGPMPDVQTDVQTDLKPV